MLVKSEIEIGRKANVGKFWQIERVSVGLPLKDFLREFRHQVTPRKKLKLTKVVNSKRMDSEIKSF